MLKAQINQMVVLNVGHVETLNKGTHDE